MDAEIEDSKARFKIFQDTAIGILRELAKTHNVPDLALLTWRVSPAAKGDPNGSPMYSIVNLNPELRNLGMYEAVPKWFYGWEDVKFMADGMPESAPTTGLPRLPAGIQPCQKTKYKTCRRWYAHKYRGCVKKCEFGGVAVDDEGGRVSLSPGADRCFFVHGLPEVPHRRK